MAKKNEISRAKIDERVEELGEFAARGGDALPTLGEEIANWAAQGAINPNAPKKEDIDAGKSVVDDIRAIFEHYTNTAGAKATHLRSVASNSIDAQVSKMRAYGKHGARQDVVGGPMDFLARVNETRDTLVRQGTKVKPAFDAMLTAIRAVKDKTDLNPEELLTAVTPAAKSEKTAMKVYEAIERLVKSLIEEKLDTSDAAKEINLKVKQQMAVIDQASKFTAYVNLGKELGIVGTIIQTDINHIQSDIPEEVE